MSAIITPQALLSYPYLFEPRAQKNDDGTTGALKYSCSLIFTADTDISALKKAYIAAVHEKFGVDKGNEMIRLKKLRSPFRTDWEAKGYPEGSTFISASSKTQPGVVSRYKDPSTGKAAKITDPNKAYAGALVRASVRLFWYEKNGNKGFSFGLQNVQVLNNDPSQYPRLDGRIAAEDEFEASDDAPAEFDGDGDSSAAAADLSDLV